MANRRLQPLSPAPGTGAATGASSPAFRPPRTRTGFHSACLASFASRLPRTMAQEERGGAAVCVQPTSSRRRSPQLGSAGAARPSPATRRSAAGSPPSRSAYGIFFWQITSVATLSSVVDSVLLSADVIARSASWLGAVVGTSYLNPTSSQMGRVGLGREFLVSADSLPGGGWRDDDRLAARAQKLAGRPERQGSRRSRRPSPRPCWPG